MRNNKPLPLEVQLKKSLESDTAYHIQKAKHYDPAILEGQREALKFESAVDFFMDISLEKCRKSFTQNSFLPINTCQCQMRL